MQDTLSRVTLGLALFGSAGATAPSTPAPVAASTCQEIKDAYQGSQCCNSNLEQVTSYHVSPPPPTIMAGSGNFCAGQQPTDPYFNNVPCLFDGVVQALEQAGANVTQGYVGHMDVGGREPIRTPYWQNGLCPVNVHWHLGTEHYSLGQYDEHGTSPNGVNGGLPSYGRRLTGSDIRAGFKCHHYDAADPKYTTPYDWKHCVDMHVGETYEIHWPHSAAGSCGTPNQYQTPFYDGVFCVGGIVSLDPLNTYQKIGVQGQVFTIVNDEHYYYPDLFRGMIVDGTMGQDIHSYTGSTTGTSRNNQVCSQYTPITWQVDRQCHIISASSFDKMCKDMKEQRDDMSGDLYPHGSRELVAHHLAANNGMRE